MVRAVAVGKTIIPPSSTNKVAVTVGVMVGATVCVTMGEFGAWVTSIWVASSPEDVSVAATRLGAPVEPAPGLALFPPPDGP